MTRTRILCILFLLLTSFASGQPKLLEDEVIIEKVKIGLANIYNNNFTESRKTLSLLRNKADGHPAVPFYEAFIIYWENYPLSPENSNAEKFLSLLEKSYSISETMLLDDPENAEAVFFELFAKAFYVMFWADNGKPVKVFPYLNSLYKQTVAGFSLKEKYNEFCFTTGLYNYYIMAYPEKHPIYKPVALLFRKGDKEYGINQLKFCAENSIFLRVEARFFLSLINLNFENNIKEASAQASLLYREFPNNSIYTALYAQLLMLDNKFPLADVLINHLENKKDEYSIMMAYILRAIYLEKYNKKYDEAFSKFEKGYKSSQQFGELAKYYTAMSLMGMGRYYQRQSDFSAANRLFKNARSLCSYENIINDRL